MTARLSVSRRALGALAVSLLAAGAAIVELPRLLKPHYPPTPYDDLLSQIGDRDAVRRMGVAVLRQTQHFNAKATAMALRARLAGRSLDQLAEEDARWNRLYDLGGWVLPETIALVGALAATKS